MRVIFQCHWGKCRRGCCSDQGFSTVALMILNHANVMRGVYGQVGTRVLISENLVREYYHACMKDDFIPDNRKIS